MRRVLHDVAKFVQQSRKEQDVELEARFQLIPNKGNRFFFSSGVHEGFFKDTYIKLSNCKEWCNDGPVRWQYTKDYFYLDGVRRTTYEQPEKNGYECPSENGTHPDEWIVKRKIDSCDVELSMIRASHHPSFNPTANPFGSIRVAIASETSLSDSDIEDYTDAKPRYLRMKKRATFNYMNRWKLELTEVRSREGLRDPDIVRGLDPTYEIEVEMIWNEEYLKNKNNESIAFSLLMKMQSLLPQQTEQERVKYTIHFPLPRILFALKPPFLKYCREQKEIHFWSRLNESSHEEVAAIRQPINNTEVANRNLSKIQQLTQAYIRHAIVECFYDRYASSWEIIKICHNSSLPDTIQHVMKVMEQMSTDILRK